MLPAALLALTSLLLTPQLTSALPPKSVSGAWNGLSAGFTARPHPDLVKHLTDARSRFVGTHVSAVHSPDGTDGAGSIVEDLKQTILVPMLGDIQLGTSAQKLSVAFSVETNDFWLISSDCNEAGCKSASSPGLATYNRNRFDKSASSTFKEDNPPTRFVNDENLGTGTMGSDTFQLGTEQKTGTDVWDVKEMGVGLIAQLTPSNDTWKNRLEQLPIDGTFGLKPTSDDGQPLSRLLSGIAEKSFTIWMQTLSSFIGSSEGKITFGASDSEHCQSDVTSIPLGAGGLSWIIGAPSAKFGSDASYEPSTDSSNTMNLFSFTDFAPDVGAIVMPAEFYRAILKTLGVTNGNGIGLDAVNDCDSKAFPHLELTWAVDADTNKTFYITKEAYAIKVEGTSQCRLTFIGLETPLWILGSPFYRSHCVKHDVAKKTIGFAKHIGDTTGNGVGSMAVMGWANLLVPTVALLSLALMM